MRLTVYLIRLLLLLYWPSVTNAQDNWKYNGQLSLGGTMNMMYGEGQRFPGFKFFCSIGLQGLYKNHLLLNYAPTLSVYTRTVGASLNPLVQDLQIDLTNSFSFGYAWCGELSYLKNFRTLHNTAHYNIFSQSTYSIVLTSNYILNNHRRNQSVGSVSFSAPGFTINYYNDGAAPFNLLPLADNFDRWWTGGLGLFIHNRKSYNYAEINFDQFTGYTPLLYELSSILGIDVPLYADKYEGKVQPRSYNTSSYAIRVFPVRNLAIDVGAIGSLVWKGKIYGLQDIIHVLGNYALHPNNDANRFYLGATYINLTNVPLQ